MTRLRRASVLVAALALAAAPGCRRRDPAPAPAPAPRLQPIPAPPAPGVRPPAPSPAPSPHVATTDGGLAPGQGPLPGSPSTFAPLVRAVRASVVSVFTAHVEMDGMQYGFRTPRERIQRGLGTGFIISPAGEILTNNHVIDDAQHIEVQLDDGRRFSASVVGRDPRLDVALLRLKAPGVELRPVQLGNSDGLEVGDWVVAIGNPYGLSQTVTAGIVSAVGRTGHEVPLGHENFGNLIQTDASINPGNSGGPLMNLRGEVVAINVAVNRAAQGIGFAIPINMAQTILPQLREFGRVNRSWLGVSVSEVSPAFAEWARLPDTRGALVRDVDPSSPAAQAGIRSGDVIVRFDGRDVNDSTQLPWLASSAGIGHRAQVELLRQSQRVTVQVTLAAMPEPAGMVVPPGSGLVPIPPPRTMP